MTLKILSRLGKDEAKSFINGVSDPFISDLLMQHYILGDTWFNIAKKIGGYSPDCLKAMCIRYLKKH